MHSLKYKSENDFTNNGWAILTFSTFKVHVNKKRNISEIYSNTSISYEDKIELDELFERKLKSIKSLLSDIGINVYTLAEKNRDKCFYLKAEIRPSAYATMVFKFFGNLSEKSRDTEIKPTIDSLNPKGHIPYKITFETIDSERLSLKIEIKD